MKKVFKRIIQIAFVICMTVAVCASVGFNNKTVANAMGYKMSQSGGTHEKWIDRLDLSEVQYARDFYDWLIENSDNDGEDDVLIDVSQKEHQIVEIKEVFSVEKYNQSQIKEEAKKRAEANFNEVADYVSMVYATFNRDYNEVFWLKREIRTTCEYSLEYVSSNEIELTQTVSVVIKNDSSKASEKFDIRLNVYANGTLDLKEEIANVNQAVENILKNIDVDATRAQKVEYFNEYLTKNNSYAIAINENSRDCRGALLGQEATSPYAPVCEGYARAFKVLCDRAGVPCVLANGTANTEEHMWNLVQMENDKWYAVDVTWNDPTTSNGSRNDKVSGFENDNYLLVGANTVIYDGNKFGQSHIETNYLYSNKIPLDNGPVLAQERYEAYSWDVSKNKGEDYVIASLCKIEGTSNYRLIISGRGAMYKYLGFDFPPWFVYTHSITEIEIDDGITEILGEPFCLILSLEYVEILGDLTLESSVFYNFGQVIYCHEGYSCFSDLTNFGYDVRSLCSVEDWTVKTHQSCLEDEVVVGSCATCGKDEERVVATKHGHKYSNWDIVNLPTQTQGGTAKKVCSYDSNHVVTCDLPAMESGAYVYSIIEEPSCEEYGTDALIYYYGGEEICLYSKIDPIGHNYVDPVYNWSNNYSRCTARKECLNSPEHAIIEVVKSTTDIVIACDYEGLVTYRATFSNDLFENQTVEVYKTAYEHEFFDGFTTDAKSHWHQCKNCEYKKDEENHLFSEWEILEEAGVFLMGEKSRVCSGCGHVENVSIPKKKLFSAISSGTMTNLDKFIIFGAGGILAFLILVTSVKVIILSKTP